MFCIIAWYGNLTLANKNWLSSLVRVASKISGRSRVHLKHFYKRQVVRKEKQPLSCSARITSCFLSFTVFPQYPPNSMAALEFKVTEVKQEVSSNAASIDEAEQHIGDTE